NLNEEGNPGEQNQLIISGGETGSPTWDEILMPKGFGEGFSMGDMKTVADETGVLLTNAGTTTPPYEENSLLTIDTEWKTLDGLETTFKVYKPNNKVNFMFQTVIQRDGG